jgi:hypothetical protein
MGPCLFCGAFVCSPKDQELFNRDSKKGHKFREQYMRKFQIKVRERERERERHQSSVVYMAFRVYIKYIIYSSIQTQYHSNPCHWQ